MTEGQLTNYLLARLIGLKEGETAETILNQAKDYFNHNKEEKEDKDDRFEFKKALLQYGVDKDLARDFLQIRKVKKAVNTESAFNLLMAEADKAGLMLKDAVKFAVEHNWSGFAEDWYYKRTHPLPGAEQPKSQPQMTSEFTKKKEEFQ